MSLARAALALAAAFAASALAAETAQWPPPGPVQERMRELQLTLGSREATAAEREAAREELSGLLKSPAGQVRGATPDEKPVRAHAPLDPLPSMVKPLAPASQMPAAPVARVDVVVPPKPLILQSGAVTTPGDRFAVDPRTGAVLHEVPGGYVDPRTGHFTPR